MLSPHLDDAVLSCGALLKDQAAARDITVATIFTEHAEPPHTRAGRTFVKQCSAPDAGTLFAERKVEDREVLEGLGVRHLHLGVEDALFRQTGADLLFCPLGVGRHVDHMITRLLGTYFPEKVVYYADFPYSLSFPTDEQFIGRHRLQAATWEQHIEAKDAMIRGYGTQADALFPDGDIPAVPETYYAALS